MQVAARVVITITSVLVQFTWLYMSYLVGNLVSLLVRNLRSSQVVTVDRSVWPALQSMLSWDWISGCSVVVALLALTLTYLVGDKPGRAFLHLATLPGWMVGLSTTLWVVLNFLLTCLTWVSSREFDFSGTLRGSFSTFTNPVTATLVAIVASAAYISTGHVALMSARWIQSVGRAARTP